MALRTRGFLAVLLRGRTSVRKRWGTTFYKVIAVVSVRLKQNVSLTLGSITDLSSLIPGFHIKIEVGVAQVR